MSETADKIANFATFTVSTAVAARYYKFANQTSWNLTTINWQKCISQLSCFNWSGC